MINRLWTTSLCLCLASCARGSAEEALDTALGDANTSRGSVEVVGDQETPGQVSGDGSGESSNQGGAGDDASVDAPVCKPFAATCSAANALGDLIGTQRTSVKGFANAKKELSYKGSGSGFVKVHIVDEFDAFGDYDFDNLVGVRATFLGDKSAQYELRITGGATMSCTEPYPGHIAKTEMGILELTSVFARYKRIPPLAGSHVNDFGDLSIEVKQLSGDCTAPFVLKISGHPCSSNCAWNTNNPCRMNKEPRTCEEVTD